MRTKNIILFRSDIKNPASIMYSINQEIIEIKDKHPASILINKCLYTQNKQKYIYINELNNEKLLSKK